MYALRKEVVGKRFLCVKEKNSQRPNSRSSRVSNPLDYPWQTGIIRACNEKDYTNKDLKVLVEYDGQAWDTREWLPVYDGRWKLFLVEKTMVWAQQPDPTNSNRSMLWPALAFFALVDKHDLNEENYSVAVEFLGDHHLAFVNNSEIRPYQDDNGLQLALRNDMKVVEELMNWQRMEKSQTILLEGSFTLTGHRVRVYRQQFRQWFSAVITAHNLLSRDLSVMDDTVLQTHSVNPMLVQIILLATDTELDSLQRGEIIKVLPVRQHRNCKVIISTPPLTSPTAGVPTSSLAGRADMCSLFVPLTQRHSNSEVVTLHYTGQQDGHQVSPSAKSTYQKNVTPPSVCSDNTGSNKRRIDPSPQQVPTQPRLSMKPSTSTCSDDGKSIMKHSVPDTYLSYTLKQSSYMKDVSPAPAVQAAPQKVAPKGRRKGDSSRRRSSGNQRNKKSATESQIKLHLSDVSEDTKPPTPLQTALSPGSAAAAMAALAAPHRTPPHTSTYIMSKSSPPETRRSPSKTSNSLSSPLRSHHPGYMQQLSPRRQQTPVTCSTSSSPYKSPPTSANVGSPLMSSPFKPSGTPDGSSNSPQSGACHLAQYSQRSHNNITTSQLYALQMQQQRRLMEQQQQLEQQQVEYLERLRHQNVRSLLSRYHTNYYQLQLMVQQQEVMQKTPLSPEQQQVVVEAYNQLLYQYQFAQLVQQLATSPRQSSQHASVSGRDDILPDNIRQQIHSAQVHQQEELRQLAPKLEADNLKTFFNALQQQEMSIHQIEQLYEQLIAQQDQLQKLKKHQEQYAKREQDNQEARLHEYLRQNQEQVQKLIQMPNSPSCLHVNETKLKEDLQCSSSTTVSNSKPAPSPASSFASSSLMATSGVSTLDASSPCSSIALVSGQKPSDYDERLVQLLNLKKKHCNASRPIPFAPVANENNYSLLHWSNEKHQTEDKKPSMPAPSPESASFVQRNVTKQENAEGSKDVIKKERYSAETYPQDVLTLAKPRGKKSAGSTGKRGMNVTVDPAVVTSSVSDVTRTPFLELFSSTDKESFRPSELSVARAGLSDSVCSGYFNTDTNTATGKAHLPASLTRDRKGKRKSGKKYVALAKEDSGKGSNTEDEKLDRGLARSDSGSDQMQVESIAWTNLNSASDVFSSPVKREESAAKDPFCNDDAFFDTNMLVLYEDKDVSSKALSKKGDDSVIKDISKKNKAARKPAGSSKETKRRRSKNEDITPEQSSEAPVFSGLLASPGAPSSSTAVEGSKTAKGGTKSCTASRNSKKTTKSAKVVTEMLSEHGRDVGSIDPSEVSHILAAAAAVKETIKTNRASNRKRKATISKDSKKVRNSPKVKSDLPDATATAVKEQSKEVDAGGNAGVKGEETTTESALTDSIRATVSSCASTVDAAVNGGVKDEETTTEGAFPDSIRTTLFSCESTVDAAVKGGVKNEEMNRESALTDSALTDSIRTTAFSCESTFDAAVNAGIKNEEMTTESAFPDSIWTTAFSCESTVDAAVNGGVKNEEMNTESALADSIRTTVFSCESTVDAAVNAGVKDEETTTESVLTDSIRTTVFSCESTVDAAVNDAVKDEGMNTGSALTDSIGTTVFSCEMTALNNEENVSITFVILDDKYAQETRKLTQGEHLSDENTAQVGSSTASKNSKKKNKSDVMEMPSEQGGDVGSVNSSDVSLTHAAAAVKETSKKNKASNRKRKAKASRESKKVRNSPKVKSGLTDVDVFPEATAMPGKERSAVDAAVNDGMKNVEMATEIVLPDNIRTTAFSFENKEDAVDAAENAAIKNEGTNTQSALTDNIRTTAFSCENKEDAVDAAEDAVIKNEGTNTESALTDYIRTTVFSCENKEDAVDAAVNAGIKNEGTNTESALTDYIRTTVFSCEMNALNNGRNVAKTLFLDEKHTPEEHLSDGNTAQVGCEDLEENAAWSSFTNAAVLNSDCPEKPEGEFSHNNSAIVAEHRTDSVNAQRTEHCLALNENTTEKSEGNKTELALENTGKDTAPQQSSEKASVNGHVSYTNAGCKDADLRKDLLFHEAMKRFIPQHTSPERKPGIHKDTDAVRSRIKIDRRPFCERSARNGLSPTKRLDSSGQDLPSDVSETSQSVSFVADQAVEDVLIAESPPPNPVKMNKFAGFSPLTEGFHKPTKTISAIVRKVNESNKRSLGSILKKKLTDEIKTEDPHADESKRPKHSRNRKRKGQADGIHSRKRTKRLGGLEIKFFIQEGCCTTLPDLPKCRECRDVQEGVVPGIDCCRFNLFRRLKRLPNGKVQAAGFLLPDNATPEEFKPWVANDHPTMGLQNSLYILHNVGYEFCNVVQTEMKAISSAGKGTVAYKRAVQGLREMCDACATTIFNVHWVCEKCGFGVCLDCYELRVKERKLQPEGSKRVFKLRWMSCGPGISHQPQNLTVAQIIPQTLLSNLEEEMHRTQAKLGIEGDFPCNPPSKHNTRLTDRPVAMETNLPTFDESEVQTTGVTNSMNDRQASTVEVFIPSKEATSSASVQGVDNVREECEDLTPVTMEIEWMKEKRQQPNKCTEKADLSSSSTSRKESVPEQPECENSRVSNGLSLLMEYSSSTESSPSVSPTVAMDELNTVPMNTFQFPYYSGLSLLANAAQSVESEETADWVVVEGSTRAPDSAPVATIAEATSSQSTVDEDLRSSRDLLTPLITEEHPAPHTWFCDGRLLRLLDTRHSGNLKAFESRWKMGEPVLVSDVHKYLNLNLWTPDAFGEEFGLEFSDVVNCKTGVVIKDFQIGAFWKGFESIKDRPVDQHGDNILLKLKDWPPGTDFSEKLPTRFEDLMNNAPLPEYTRRDGCRNLVSRLPQFFATPDLGPKMYNAYGSASCSKAGTTNLHLDMSDAVNVMVYVGVPKDEGAGEKEREDAIAAADKACDASQRQRIRDPATRIGAIWHIYAAEDADKIRALLHEVAKERNMKYPAYHDPIHDQCFYLDYEIRRRLKEEYGVEGWGICQCLGDAVFIPAGAPHQVRNMHSCVKVAEDFVSPEHISHCFRMTQEFRYLSSKHTNHEDKLQVKNIIYHAIKDAVHELKGHLQGAASDKMENSSEMKEINSTTKEVNSEMTEVNSTTKEVNSDTMGVNSQTTKVNSQTKKVNSQTTKVNSQTTKVNSQTKKVNSQTKKVNSQTMKVNSQTKVKSQLKKVNSQTKKVNSQTKVNSKTKKVNSKTTDVKKTDVNSQMTEVNSQMMEFNSHTKEVNSHTKEVNSHTKEVNSHTMEVNSQTTDVNSEMEISKSNTQDAS